MAKRRWSMRGRDLRHREGWLHVGVSEATGEIGLQIEGSVVVLQPQDAARLRQVLADAVARALQDRDGW